MQIAYCFRDGRIHTGPAVPEGAVELFRGPTVEIARLIEDVADEGWIPGLETSKTMEEDQQHLLAFLAKSRESAGPLVTVSDISQEVLESDHEVTA